MMTRMGLILLAPVLVAADAKDDAAKQDLKQIQGAWQAVAGERGGEKAPKEMMAALRFVFKGDKLIIHEGKKTKEGTFQLDAAKTPKLIHMKINGGEVVGIYQLDGGSLKICVNRNDNEPPKEFKSPKGSRVQLVTFRRAKN